MGIIDSLSAGYKLISRRWWLILIPILLDLFLWMGPRIGLTHVAADITALLVVPAEVELGEEYQVSLDQMQQLLDQVAGDANLFTLLGAGIPGVPSLMATIATQARLLPTEQMVTQVGSLGNAILLGLGLLMVGTLLATVYVSWIGRSVLAEYQELRDMPALEHTFQTWARVLLFILGILALILILGIPAMLLVGLMMLLSQGVGILLLNLMSIFLLWFGIWVAIYLYFVVDSIVLNRVSVFRAVWNSVNVVLRNFWPTVGLIVLVNVINAGMILIWRQLVFASWSTLIGIVANAFVGSGLVAASLIFYNGRFALWQETQDSSGISNWFGNWGGPKTS